MLNCIMMKYLLIFIINKMDYAFLVSLSTLSYFGYRHYNGINLDIINLI